MKIKVFQAKLVFLLFLFCIVELSCTQSGSLPKKKDVAKRTNSLLCNTVVVSWKTFWEVCKGNGTIIHSSKEHGTFVLTARHVVEDHEDDLKIGIYKHSFIDAGKAKKEYSIFPGVVVYPHKIDDKNTKAEKVLDQLKAIASDWALVKLDTNLVFKTADLWIEESFPSLDKEKVEVIGICPEDYPHSHINKGISELSEDVVKPGHSGSGIFYKEKLVCIIARYVKSSNRAFSLPKIPDIIKQLNNAKLGYIIPIYAGDSR